MTVKASQSGSPAYISAAQVLERYGGRSHMWLERRLKNDSRFPRPVKVGRLRFFELSKLEDYERICAAEQQD